MIIEWILEKVLFELQQRMAALQECSWHWLPIAVKWLNLWLLVALVLVCRTQRECGAQHSYKKCKVHVITKVWSVIYEYNYIEWLAICRAVLKEDLLSVTWFKLFQSLISEGKKEYMQEAINSREYRLFNHCSI